MTDTSYAKSGHRQVRRRDWIVLPLLAVLTSVVLVGSVELAARWRFPVPHGTADSCFVMNDPVRGVYGKPGCTFNGKNEDSDPVLYQLDANGYRNPPGLATRSPQSFRILLAGSSMAFGLFVPEQETMAALLPDLLQTRTGRPVELYDEGILRAYKIHSYVRLQDPSHTTPDLVLWMLGPTDMRDAAMDGLPKLMDRSDPGLLPWMMHRLREHFADGNLQVALGHMLAETRTEFASRYYAYRSPTLYLRSYLAQVDYENGFLRTHLSPGWKANLEQIGSDLADVSRQAKAAHIPLAVFYVPNHAQAEMVAMGKWPKGYDPYQLNEVLRQMVTADGDTFLDILPGYRTVPVEEIQHDYYLVDGHPNAGGQALMARLTAQALLRNPPPGLLDNTGKPAPQKGAY